MTSNAAAQVAPTQSIPAIGTECTKKQWTARRLAGSRADGSTELCRHPHPMSKGGIRGVVCRDGSDRRQGKRAQVSQTTPPMPLPAKIDPSMAGPFGDTHDRPSVRWAVREKHTLQATGGHPM
ncbi:hypothetical protein SAMN04244547_05202 [Azotobacter vinelandii]|nr:hypothetical protein SAMN04244547_05202 [Azotobacter vinelandii]